MPATVAEAVAETVATQCESMKRESLARWRRWVRDVAKGKPAPAPQDILNTAAILEIRDPGPAFDADVEAIVEYDNAKRLLAKCEAHRDGLLAPYGGDLRGLEAAVEEAEAAARALRETLNSWNNGCGTTHYGSVMFMARHNNPRALGDTK